MKTICKNDLTEEIIYSFLCTVKDCDTMSDTSLYRDNIPLKNDIITCEHCGTDYLFTDTLLETIVDSR